jgi:hypothetical protein
MWNKMLDYVWFVVFTRRLRPSCNGCWWDVLDQLKSLVTDLEGDFEGFHISLSLH